MQNMDIKAAARKRYLALIQLQKRVNIATQKAAAEYHEMIRGEGEVLGLIKATNAKPVADFSGTERVHEYLREAAGELQDAGLEHLAEGVFVIREMLVEEFKKSKKSNRG